MHFYIFSFLFVMGGEMSLLLLLLLFHTHDRTAMPFGNRKKYFRESFKFSIHPSAGNLKFNNLAFFKA